MNNEDFSIKAESLAEKMNKITAKITENLDIAEELEVVSADVIEQVKEKSNAISTFQNCTDVTLISEAEAINIQVMTEDFAYGRNILKDQIENTKKILNQLTLNVIGNEEETNAEVISSYAELNKSLTDCMKLFFGSWKDMSAVVIGLDKIKEKIDQGQTINNTVNINTSDSISTVDLIAKLRGK